MFLLLLPLGLRIEPLYTVAVNGMIVSALAGWLARPERPCHWTGACILLALLIGWAAMTVLWAADPVSSRRELIAWLISFILLFLLVNQVDSLRAMDRLMATLGAFGWMVVLGSFYAVLFTDYDFVRRLRVMGMNENGLGVVLILMLPGILWPVLRSTGRRRVILMTLSVVYILCTLVFVALSGSRGSAISLVLILFSFLLARSTRPWGFVGFALVAGGVLVTPFLFHILLQRFSEEDGGEIGGRGELWEASMMFIRDQPFTGAGVGNGPVALHDYIAAVTSIYNHRMDLPSHQPVLEVGVDVGVVGIALYVAAIGAALWSFARSRRLWAGIAGAPDGYHMIVAGTAVGYMSSWIKGGGLKNNPTFFLLLALLLLPACLARSTAKCRPRGSASPYRPMEVADA
ncbi:O-antigen ligase family protein [Methylobacterium dankookense]|uniref:O-antigen ligase family protein n=1 Tax=Methylobacterium dankookense TaxID=560405 RepID=UPI0016438865|nr:O-antigen ligase family protein [Methylobacterium dankookense]